MVRNFMPVMVLGVLCLGVGVLPVALARSTGPTAEAAPPPATPPAMTGATTAHPVEDSPADSPPGIPSLAPAGHSVAVGSARIAYKQDNNGAGLGGLFLRLAGSLLLMAALAFAVIVLAKRYLPGIRGFSADGKSHVQLLESKRVTPKLTLFVIEYEGRRLLLAQSGDRVVEIGAHHE
jgi:hypothetical protein